LLACRIAAADEPKPPAVEDVKMSKKEKEFAAMLNGVDLVGFSARDDKEEGKVTPDRYSIEEAVKIDDTHWQIKVGIQTGQVVFVFPLTLEVQWAGDTPVITLTDVAVGPLGTFTARVLFYRGRYAGTWSHGAKDGGNAIGGQIFGKIVPRDKPPAKPPAKPATDPPA
jgi:hypothetical protein